VEVMVGLESRFRRTPGGDVWTDSVCHAAFWERYLTVFDRVGVVARVTEVESVPPDWRRVDGERIWVAALPDYQQAWQMARSYWDVAARLRQWRGRRCAFILRVPGHVAHHIERTLLSSGQPFAVEVVGDPHDVFAPGGVRGLARPLWRHLAVRALRAQCAHAVAAAYVTREALQRRYPPAPQAFTTHYSSVDLGSDSYVAQPAPVRADGRRLLFAGTLETLYKGPDTLLRAVARCRNNGDTLTLRIVGDGRERPRLMRLASSLGLGEAVTFVGQLPPGEAIRQEMDAADLVVLPSRQEGLPRVIIEAMARAVPCVASSVGGIPELLGPDALVAPDDATALARLITEVLSNPQRRQAMAAANLRRARDYHRDVLAERRQAFYEAVRDLTRRHYGSSLEGGDVPGR